MAAKLLQINPHSYFLSQNTPKMAASLSTLHFQPPSKLSSSITRHSTQSSIHINYFTNYKNTLKFNSSKLTLKALTESSDSPNSLDQQDPQFLLQELADCFVLPVDYFSQLPSDLRLDLNDAAFDLSNGLVKDECGEELGETLLNLSRAWERADTSTSATLTSKLPLLASSLSSNNKSALGKRLISAGRRFQSMGQYGQGELEKIAKNMIKAGQLLSMNPTSEVTSEEPKEETRMFKFGDLQVELTSQKAYIGAGIGFGFAILSWQVSQGIQSIPESSLQYANDNALQLAKSLRGALLAIFYTSTILSGFASVGLVLYGRQLKSGGK